MPHPQPSGQEALTAPTKSGRRRNSLQSGLVSIHAEPFREGCILSLWEVYSRPAGRHSGGLP